MKNLRGLTIITAVLLLMTTGVFAATPVIQSYVVQYFNDFTGTFDKTALVGGKVILATYNYTYSNKQLNINWSSTFSANNTAQVGGTWKPPAPWNNGTIVQVNARYYWDNQVTSYYDRYHGVQAASSAPGTGFVTPSGSNGTWYDGDYNISVNSNTGLRLTGYVGSWTTATTSYMRRAKISGSFIAWRPSGKFSSKVLEINTLDGSGGKFYSFGKLNCYAAPPSGTNIVIEMRASDTVFAANAATPSWSTVATIDDNNSTPMPAPNLNNTFGGVDSKYFQFRVTLNGTSTTSNPTPATNANGTPRLEMLGAELVFEGTMTDPEAHDSHFSYDSTSSFNKTGATFDGGKILRAGTGLRVQQYTQYGVARSVNTSNSINPPQTNAWVQNAAANGSGWFPPYPGTIKKVNVKLYWITSSETSYYNQKAYIKKVSGGPGTNTVLPTSAPGNGFYQGIKNVNVNSNQGLKMTAWGNIWHDTPNAASGNGTSNQTSYLYTAYCDELKYHVDSAYYSQIHCYGDPADGGNGFSWAQIMWNTLYSDASNTIKLYVRGDANTFSTTAGPGTTDVDWTLVLDTETGQNDDDLSALLYEKPYMQFRINFHTNTYKTPEVDWVTIKYFTNTAPTLTIIDAIKGSASYPDYDGNPGYHAKPPLTGSPNNDVRYSTGLTCGSWPNNHVDPVDTNSHSEKPNLIPRVATADPELYIRVKITDPENDPVTTTNWQYTVKSDMDNNIWYNFAAGDIKWDHRNSSHALVASPEGDLIAVDSPKSPLAVSSDYYTLCISNLNNIFAGAYTHLYFRCKAYDTIFETDFVTMTESQKFFVDFNSPPVINSADLEILPDPAYTTDTLTLNTSSSASDPDAISNAMNGFRIDDEHLSFVTEWSVNGSAITGINTPTLPSNYFIKGDLVEVSVYPFDGSVTATDFPERGKEFGTKASTTRTIKNKPPVITSITLSPSTPYTNDDLICTVVATDDDEFIWRQTDFQDATINNVDMGDGVFDPINCDGNITTTDVDLDGEWELQLK